MTHLGERITDFVFGELSTTEMDEARQHIAVCADCHKQVEEFEVTRAMLQMSPDVEPPRRIAFEVEKRRSWDLWRWLVPAGVAAAILVAILLALPMQVQWNDSQLTIAFGRPPVSPSGQPVQQSPARMEPAMEPVVQPVDYERIVKQVQDTQQPWLLSEIGKRDAARVVEIQRLGDQLDYMKAQLNAAERKNLENASSIQVLEQKTGVQD